MNKETFEGAARSTLGQGEKVVGQVARDGSISARGAYDDVAGKLQSAAGSAKDALNSGVDAVNSIDFSGLRDEVAQLSQTVANLVQSQAAATRDQVVGAIGLASDNLSQSASMAQDKFVSIEGDVEARIKKSPWTAVAVAGLVGLLVGKMT
jgi:ElaB/YqjD/DUF883 family membrane-anchored ribosome-binding protein